MKKMLLSAAVAAISLGLAANASALTTFMAYDEGAATASAATGSNAEEALFDASAGSTGLITFESAPLGDANGLTVAPGVTLSGADYSGADQTIVTTSACGAALCGFNITSGGSKFLDANGGTVTFHFATPITSFGLYVTGVQLTDSLVVGGTTVVSETGVVTDGGVAFLGFTGATPFTSVTLMAGSASTGDIVGVDNVEYSLAEVPPPPPPPPPPPAVPEPATWAMMLAGVGLVGAVLRRRTRTLAV